MLSFHEISNSDERSTFDERIVEKAGKPNFAFGNSPSKELVGAEFICRNETLLTSQHRASEQAALARSKCGSDYDARL